MMIRYKKLALCIAAIALMMFLACEQSEDDPNNFVIKGSVLQSKLFPIGVEGVLIDITLIPTNSIGEATVIDDITYSDQNGEFKYSAFATFPSLDETGYDYYYYALAVVNFSFTESSGSVVTYQLSGIRVVISEDRVLEPIYLTQFN